MVGNLSKGEMQRKYQLHFKAETEKKKEKKAVNLHFFKNIHKRKKANLDLFIGVKTKFRSPEM